MVRKGFSLQLSREIPVNILDVPPLRDTATLEADRGHGGTRSASSLALGQLIVLVTRQQCPDNTGILVCDYDRRAVFAATLDQLPYPLAPPVRFTSHPAQRRPCSVDKEVAEIAIVSYNS